MKIVTHVDHLLSYPEYSKLKAFLIRNAVSISDSGCWNWKRSLSNEGRAVIRILGKIHHTSRVSFVVFKKEPVGDMLVCHSCDNPICVNPEHLWLGTPKDNMVDMSNRGRYRDQKGTKHNLVKLTEEDVLNIRDKVATGYTQKSMADKYGISFQQVSRIVRKERWKHL
jgi:hypothetical protein